MCKRLLNELKVVRQHGNASDATTTATVTVAAFHRKKDFIGPYSNINNANAKVSTVILALVLSLPLSLSLTPSQ